MPVQEKKEAIEWEWKNIKSHAWILCRCGKEFYASGTDKDMDVFWKRVNSHHCKPTPKANAHRST